MQVTIESEINNLETRKLIDKFYDNKTIDVNGQKYKIDRFDTFYDKFNKSNDLSTHVKFTLMQAQEKEDNSSRV